MSRGKGMTKNIIYEVEIGSRVYFRYYESVKVLTFEDLCEIL